MPPRLLIVRLLVRIAWAYYSCFFVVVISTVQTELVPVFKDNEGSVTITPQALRELVRKSCLYIDGIHSPSTYIKLQRSKLRLKVKIRLAEGVNVKNTRRLLKQNIEAVMLENLNFSNFSGIDIIIRGFLESKNIKEND